MRGTLTGDNSIIHLLNDQGKLNTAGQHLLIELLHHLDPHQWGEAFIPLKKRGVHCAVELVIVHDTNTSVLLTRRDDNFFCGWHLPGAYMFQGDSWQDAATRCARRELGIDVRVIRTLNPIMNNTDNQRFHDVTVLLLCRIVEGEPIMGRWFGEYPKDIISPQEKYRPVIYDILSHYQQIRHSTFFQQRQTP